MLKLLSGADAAIGNTPIVNLSRIVARHGLRGGIFAKLEYLNPGFSKKDRIAKQIIEEAEASGALQRGRAVVELTSGNTGTGLAIVCAVRGYKFYACMSKGNSAERARMMRALGAEVVLVDQAAGSAPGQVSGEDLALVEAKARELTEELGAFRADQFTLAGNVRAHELHTAEEIWEACGENFGAFADFMGTGGSFAGCAKTFKRRDASIGCYAVEPEAAAHYAMKHRRAGARSAAAGEVSSGHSIQGGGYSMELPLVPPELIDGVVTVTDAEAVTAARELAKYEGVFAGYSSGANVCAALRLLGGEAEGKNIVVLLNDSGLKYLSTDLY